jgi:hypothetical protein
VHDYKMGEACPSRHLGVRRTPLDEPLDDFFFDQSYRHAWAPRAPHGRRQPSARWSTWTCGRKIAELPIAGMPHLGSGITFDWKGTTVLASPNLKDGAIRRDRHEDLEARQDHPTPGPGFFMRSHEKTPLRLDRLDDEPDGQDTLTMIDKRTLEPVATLVREPGKTLAHIEFTATASTPWPACGRWTAP